MGTYGPTTVYMDFPYVTQICYNAQVAQLGYISLKINDTPILSIYNYSNTNGFASGSYYYRITKFTLYMENGYYGPDGPAGAMACTIMY
jgi:hypothetical protein